MILKTGRLQRDSVEAEVASASYNKFNGNIPDSIGQCSSLELLDLSYNQLTNVMPLQVASLRNLQFYFNVSHNTLAGRLPAELGGMQMVQAIDISANHFSGSIPSQIVNCVGLEYLNISYIFIGRHDSNFNWSTYRPSRYGFLFQ
jgi:hypothetical protein